MQVYPKDHVSKHPNSLTHQSRVSTEATVAPGPSRSTAATAQMQLPALAAATVAAGYLGRGSNRRQQRNTFQTSKCYRQQVTVRVLHGGWDIVDA